MMVVVIGLGDKQDVQDVMERKLISHQGGGSPRPYLLQAQFVLGLAQDLVPAHLALLTVSPCSKSLIRQATRSGAWLMPQ